MNIELDAIRERAENGDPQAAHNLEAWQSASADRSDLLEHVDTLRGQLASVLMDHDEVCVRQDELEHQAANLLAHQQAQRIVLLRETVVAGEYQHAARTTLRAENERKDAENERLRAALERVREICDEALPYSGLTIADTTAVRAVAALGEEVRDA